MTNPSSFDRHPDWVGYWVGGYIYNSQAGKSSIFIILSEDSYGVAYKSTSVEVCELQARVLAAMHPDEVRRWAEGRLDEAE